MDPCCGSGHFLVEAFSMLWQMRVEEEGLRPAAAQDAVLRDNLFGLELDQRCVQIAMFAIALQAWKTGGGWRELPIPHIACTGIPVKAPVDEWKSLGRGDARLGNALIRLHVLFRDADTLGSLIDPRPVVEVTEPTELQRSLEDVDWEEVAPLLSEALHREAADPATAVFGTHAAGIARAADYLSRQYTLITTNPPFLGRSKQSDCLKAYVEGSDTDAKADLALAMMMRGLAMCCSGGTIAYVTPQTWLQLKRSRALRERVLRRYRFRGCVWLGTGAFDGLSGEVVTAALITVSKVLDTAGSMFIIDCQAANGTADKARMLRQAEMRSILQCVQLDNPASRVLPSLVSASTIGDIGDSHQGIKTSDNPRFVRFFWEIPAIRDGWRRMQSAPEVTVDFGGRSEIVFWEDGFGVMTEVCQEGAAFRGRAAWNRQGVVVREMGLLPATLYSGDLYDGTGSVIIPRASSDLPALWAFCSSPELHSSVRSIDTSLKVSSGTLNSVPMDADRWRRLGENELPEPWSDDPRQWLFQGRPENATEPLQVAVGRLLGYRWPDQVEHDDLDSFTDDDGIVCLPSVLGEPAAAERLRDLLARAYSSTWSPTKTSEVLAASASRKRDLVSWLRDDFFKAHCKLFENRPFVWHVWDGRRDGFGALVNYHKLDRAALERLTFTYLGDWIERQIAGSRDDAPGAEERLAAAQDLQGRLQLILAGESPYDVYVRWKSLADQPLGWEPDLNDGVRLNMRPFVEAEVLRSKVNVKWGKDRGRDRDGSERYNDLHFTRAEKEAAREGVWV